MSQKFHSLSIQTTPPRPPSSCTKKKQKKKAAQTSFFRLQFPICSSENVVREPCRSPEGHGVSDKNLRPSALAHNSQTRLFSGTTMEGARRRWTTIGAAPTEGHRLGGDELCPDLPTKRLLPMEAARSESCYED